MDLVSTPQEAKMGPVTMRLSPEPTKKNNYINKPKLQTTLRHDTAQGTIIMTIKRLPAKAKNCHFSFVITSTSVPNKRTT